MTDIMYWIKYEFTELKGQEMSELISGDDDPSHGLSLDEAKLQGNAVLSFLDEQSFICSLWVRIDYKEGKRGRKRSTLKIYRLNGECKPAESLN